VNDKAGGLPAGAVVLIPIGQIAAAVITEVSTARARGRRERR
jgi:hypothetical protein